MVAKGGAPKDVVVLDNEALQVLADVSHPKHYRLLAILQAAAHRNRQRQATASIMTTTAVRVEAQIDRRSPKVAKLNSLRVRDVPLDTDRADRAAVLKLHAGGSVADATVAEAAITAAGEGIATTVYTSDLSGIPALTAVRTLRVRVVRI